MTVPAAERKDQIKQDFINARGYWSKSWDTPQPSPHFA